MNVLLPLRNLSFRFIPFFLLLISVFVIGQEPVLDQYIHTAIENNLGLKQEESLLEQKYWKLKEAQSWFYPNLGFNARYSVAQGGRTIDLPIGDMLNDVYGTLNSLTNGVFPNSRLENRTIYFIRPTEQVTQLSLVQPLFNPEIWFSSKIAKELYANQQITFDIYKRELIAEVKIAYFNFLKSVEALKVLEKSMVLANENIRVNKKLYENDKVTLNAVYKSKSELSRLEQQKTDLVKLNKAAIAYFNFLLNRDLSEEVFTDSTYHVPMVSIGIDSAIADAISARAEIEQIESFKSIRDFEVKMKKYNALPVLFASVDYGYQGEKYSFTNEDDFVIASLILKWDLFKGFQNKSKIQQAKIEQQTLDYKEAELKKQIELQVINAYYDLKASQEAIVAAEKQVVSERKNYDILHHQFENGKASLIELIDAQTSLHTAEDNKIVKKYDYFIKYTEYQKVISY